MSGWKKNGWFSSKGNFGFLLLRSTLWFNSGYSPKRLAHWRLDPANDAIAWELGHAFLIKGSIHWEFQRLEKVSRCVCVHVWNRGGGVMFKSIPCPQSLPVGLSFSWASLFCHTLLVIQPDLTTKGHRPKPLDSGVNLFSFKMFFFSSIFTQRLKNQHTRY